MGLYRESITKEAVSALEGGEVVLGPRDLTVMPRRTLVFACAAGEGKLGLAAAKVQVGPTVAGPWLDEDIGATIPTLAAGAAAAYRMDKADPFVRVLATAATPGEGEQTDLTIYLEALG